MSGFFGSIQGLIGSITGALKWSGSAFAQAATTDLSDVTAPASWTPTDQSGAGLAFTSVSGAYCKIGNMVFVYGTLTYPSTSNGNNATISLPVAVPNQTYAGQVGSYIGSSLTNLVIRAVPNSSTANVVNSNTFGIETNANMSTHPVTFLLIYPVI